ncbi:MAG: T9SS type A sorting domain-containing protein [Saprospiraceae bacterium]
MISISVYGQRTVDIRVKEIGINTHSQTLNVEIQVRKTDRVALILGGYNMRLYYNSEKLQLSENKARSMLTSSKYTPIEIDNHLKNVDVTGHGLISYSQNLSFLSFYSNLKTISTQGDVVSDGGDWKSIAGLEFKILQPFQNEEVITLAREEKTGELATAFIEMTEWKGPKNIQALEVNEYFEDIKGFDQESEAFVQIKVGPNPASTDLNIDFSKELQGNDYSVTVRNVAGAKVLNRKINQGSKGIILDIRNLLSANYLVEVRNDNEIIKTKKIIKIN